MKKLIVIFSLMLLAFALSACSEGENAEELQKDIFFSGTILEIDGSNAVVEPWEREPILETYNEISVDIGSVEEKLEVDDTIKIFYDGVVADSNPVQVNVESIEVLNYQKKINSTFLYVLGAIVAGFVLLQSSIFLIRAYKQGLAMGMDKKKLLGAIKSSAIFSIVPSIPIVIGVFTLMKAIGVPMAWIRLSVVGAVTYELPAAEAAATAMGMSGLNDQYFNMNVFAGVALTMSIGIITGLVLSIFNGVKAVQNRMDKMQNTDRKWGEMFVAALFMGLVAAFCGYIITPPIVGMIQGSVPAYQGITTILVLVTSAVLMLILTAISKASEKLKWIEQFALPVSMILAMVMAVFYHVWLGGSI